MEGMDGHGWVSGSEEQVAEQAAAFITAEACRAVAARGCFSLVLAGGTTPRRLYELLAGRARETVGATLPWRQTFLFQGDERYVPSTHPDSNYGMARETLLMHIGIPPQQIVRMPVDSGDATEDARRYESMLRDVFRKPGWRSERGFPVFDLVMLGLGDDGHTASLFPGNREALEEDVRWTIPVDAPDARPPGSRLTMTLPVINNAESAMFLVPSGRYGLAWSIHTGQRPDLPAGMVRPRSGKLFWFVAGRK